MMACLGFFSLWRGKLPLSVNFLHGLKLREMPCFKGSCGLSTLNRKKSFIHGKIFIGNLFMPYECLSVASCNA